MTTLCQKGPPSAQVNAYGLHHLLQSLAPTDAILACVQTVPLDQYRSVNGDRLRAYVGRVGVELPLGPVWAADHAHEIFGHRFVGLFIARGNVGYLWEHLQRRTSDHDELEVTCWADMCHAGTSANDLVANLDRCIDVSMQARAARLVAPVVRSKTTHFPGTITTVHQVLPDRRQWFLASATHDATACMLLRSSMEDLSHSKSTIQHQLVATLFALLTTTNTKHVDIVLERCSVLRHTPGALRNWPHNDADSITILYRGARHSALATKHPTTGLPPGTAVPRPLRSQRRRYGGAQDTVLGTWRHSGHRAAAHPVCCLQTWRSPRCVVLTFSLHCVTYSHNVIRGRHANLEPLVLPSPDTAWHSLTRREVLQQQADTTWVTVMQDAATSARALLRSGLYLHASLIMERKDLPKARQEVEELRGLLAVAMGKRSPVPVARSSRVC